MIEGAASAQRITPSHSESKNADSKEFNRILKKTKPPTFSGGTTKGYLSWKNSVKSEVSSLNLSPDQWYELLIHRTTGEALSLVESYGSDAGELPMKNIIESLWKELDRLFLPSVKPSRDLLLSLIHI